MTLRHTRISVQSGALAFWGGCWYSGHSAVALAFHALGGGRFGTGLAFVQVGHNSVYECKSFAQFYVVSVSSRPGLVPAVNAGQRLASPSMIRWFESSVSVRWTRAEAILETRPREQMRVGDPIDCRRLQKTIFKSPFIVLSSSVHRRRILTARSSCMSL